jgi:ABC-type amino acid transport substrate-binding protein
LPAAVIGASRLAAFGFMQEHAMSMLSRILAALTLSAMLAAPAARADDAAAIRSVIDGQLQAFQADDWAGAFAFAAPSIQRIFRNPQGFAAMVKGGYPMVWRPGRVEVGPLEQGPRGPVQIMYFDGPDGVAYVAAYEMTQVDGAWRIAGVRIRKAPAASV